MHCIFGSCKHVELCGCAMWFEIFFAAARESLGIVAAKQNVMLATCGRAGLGSEEIYYEEKLLRKRKSWISSLRSTSPPPGGVDLVMSSSRSAMRWSSEDER